MRPDPVECVRRAAEAAWPVRCPRCGGPLGFEPYDVCAPSDAGALAWIAVIGTHTCTPDRHGHGRQPT